MEFHFSKGLDTAPLAREIRRKVFVAEQGFSEELEFDDIDQTAWHIVLTSRGKPVGTGRLFVRNPNRPSVFTIGRLAVLREYRKTGAGRLIMEYLEKEAARLGAGMLILCAQVQAQGFYKKCGYRRTLHRPVDDEGVPHVYMEKRIKFPKSKREKRKIALQSAAILLAIWLTVYGIGGEILYRNLLAPTNYPAGDFSTSEEMEETSGWEALPAENGNFLYARRVIHTEFDNRWILLLHPYRCDSSYMRQYAEHFYRMGYSLLIPDLRGHGRSSWAPISMGIQDGQDISAWCKKLASDYPGCSIGIFGLSMGGAAALTASGKKLPENVKAIAEDSAYLSPWDALSRKLRTDTGLLSFPFLNAADSLSFLYNGYSLASASCLSSVIHSSIPTLFIHGGEDTIVPVSDMERLYASATCPKEKLVIPGASHAQCAQTDPELYWFTVERFFSIHLSPTSSISEAE